MSSVDTTVPDETIDLAAIEADILEALSIGEMFACVEGSDEQIREVQAAPEKVRALLAEVRRLTEERDEAHATARIEGATAMREAILGLRRWSGVGAQAILDLDPAAVVGSGL